MASEIEFILDSLSDQHFIGGADGWGTGRSRGTVLRLLERMRRGGEDLTAEPAVTAEVIGMVMTYRQYGEKKVWLPKAEHAHQLFQAARDELAAREDLRLNPCPHHDPEWECAECVARLGNLGAVVIELRDGVR